MPNVRVAPPALNAPVRIGCIDGRVVAVARGAKPTGSAQSDFRATGRSDRSYSSARSSLSGHDTDKATRGFDISGRRVERFYVSDEAGLLSLGAFVTFANNLTLGFYVIAVEGEP